MLDDPLLTDVLDVSDAAGSVPERARAWLRLLDRVVPFDAAWVSLSTPGSGRQQVVASSGIDADARGDLELWPARPAPAGFEQVLRAALVEPDGDQVGVVGLLYRASEPPSALARSMLARLSPLMARAFSPTRALLASARLVPGADAGVLLTGDGTIHPVPGMEGHGLLAVDSPVVGVAVECLTAGLVSRSFLWPAPRPDREGNHVRLTLVSATGIPGVGGGILLLTDGADCHGLTPRELQVLGLLVAGRSNQQISRSLAVTPRTVATHVEHVMRKLEAPSRTLAAVLAERDGFYVPTP